MKCLICNKNKAEKVDIYGYLPCLSCQNKHKKIGKPKTPTELTTEEIKEQRKIYEKDITQAFRDGDLSKEYAEAYPDRVKTMLKEKHITEEEVKNARYTWTENNYYKK